MSSLPSIIPPPSIPSTSPSLLSLSPPSWLSPSPLPSSSASLVPPPSPNFLASPPSSLVSPSLLLLSFPASLSVLPSLLLNSSSPLLLFWIFLSRKLMLDVFNVDLVKYYFLFFNCKSICSFIEYLLLYVNRFLKMLFSLIDVRSIFFPAAVVTNHT